MRVTIIPADGFVSVDGKGFLGLDLSFMDKSIQAVQWYGEEGEVEIKNITTGKIIENRQIDSFDDFQLALDVWGAENDKPPPVSVEFVENQVPVEGVN
jgi:hypothetical protein